MLEQGEVFAGFTVERLLGQGGMGSVYLARHPRTGKRTALKLLNRDLFTDQQVRARFEREADLVAQLDHPGIIAVYDRGSENDQLWISMQYVDGVDAASVNALALPPERAVQIIEGVADALDYAHARGVLHRDVKPANILLARAGKGKGERVFLSDFGIARLREDTTHLTQTGMFTATLAYASPEQMTGAPLGNRSDQYSLACTLYWLLTGVGPFDADNPADIIHGHLELAAVPVTRRRPGLNPALDLVLAAGMAKLPEHRYRTCAEFAAAARTALTAVGPPPLPAPPPPAPPVYPQHAPAPPGYGPVPPGLAPPVAPVPRVVRYQVPPPPVAPAQAPPPVQAPIPADPKPFGESASPAERVSLVKGTPSRGSGEAGGAGPVAPGGQPTDGAPRQSAEPNIEAVEQHPAGASPSGGVPPRFDPSGGHPPGGYGPGPVQQAYPPNPGERPRPSFAVRGAWIAPVILGVVAVLALVVGVVVVVQMRTDPAAAPSPEAAATPTTTPSRSVTSDPFMMSRKVFSGLLPQGSDTEGPGYGATTCHAHRREETLRIDEPTLSSGPWLIAWECLASAGSERSMDYVILHYDSPRVVGEVVADLPAAIESVGRKDGEPVTQRVWVEADSRQALVHTANLAVTFPADSPRGSYLLYATHTGASRHPLAPLPSADEQLVAWWADAPV
ncbi:serine/threonine protein kinase [Nocardia higoensis]|uniref:non-specific serine/threonine protein kinase n=1 Tax=Nocardia higoensis TaxID=228599 RepID=A0ABS0D8M1_9NOCA|nr:serine/threonine-protein kinase [Nocardia higoensis]MBF6354822.1 serine/threonine protein kinase [Nocardia higoensis]